MRGIINVLKWMLIILFIIVLIIYFGLYPWIKSKFTADDVDVARKDEFIQLFSDVKLEFMGDFQEQEYYGGEDSGETYVLKECGISVYKINTDIANYLEKTKANKEIKQYFYNKIKFYSQYENEYNSSTYDDLTSYVKKYRINDIDKIVLSEKVTGVKYFDMELYSEVFSKEPGYRGLEISKVYDKYKYYKSYYVPELFFEKKIKCLFDHDNYYERIKRFKDDGLIYYLYTRFIRLYPNYFSFYNLNDYQKMIKDKSGFYVVIPDKDIVYVLQPKHNRIFKLY